MARSENEAATRDVWTYRAWVSIHNDPKPYGWHSGFGIEEEFVVCNETEAKRAAWRRAAQHAIDEGCDTVRMEFIRRGPATNYQEPRT